MPQVPVQIRKARAARLRDTGAAALAAFLESRVGTTARVLVEKPGFGRSEHYAPVETSAGTPGEILPLHITGAARGRLQGRRAA
jgi:threonylcarbamoyladenosine tRNA methylthiotransferase MtaB